MDAGEPTETVCITAATTNVMVVRALASATPAAGTAGSSCTDSSGRQGTTVQILSAPEIQWTQNGTTNTISVVDDGSGTTPTAQQAVVGQQVKLTTIPAAEDLTALGLAFSENKWTVGGTNIGGFTVSPDFSSAAVTATELKTASLNSFWVYPGSSIPVTYQYCVNIPGVGNQCSQTANATFSVTGPTATITPSPSSWSVSPQMSCPTSVQLLYFGYPDPTSGCIAVPLVKGISFQAALSNVPDSGGTTEWVQLVRKNTLSGTTLSGGKAGPTSQGVGLDNTYPYRPDDLTEAVTTQASDSPSNSLDSTLAKETRRFRADMYYLWRPQIPGSIFVPLGYVEWSTSGTAAQNTKSTPPWSVESSGTTSAIFYTGSDTGNSHGFPTWNSTVANSQSNDNENDDEGEGLEEQQ